VRRTVDGHPLKSSFSTSRNIIKPSRDLLHPKTTLATTAATAAATTAATTAM
jgi:hypothetical protein